MDLSVFFRDLLHKYTLHIFGDYFNTALLLVFGILFAAVFYFLPKKSRKASVFIAGILFILISSPLINFAAFSLILVVLFACSNYGFPARKWIFWITEAALILSTVILYKVFNVFSAFFSFAAYYTAYRTIHYFIDASQNPQSKKGFFDYLSYIFFFPSFSHGPVERIENVVFNDVGRGQLLFGLKRILIGVLKFLLLAYIFPKMPEATFSFSELHKWLLFTAYIGAIKLYLIFSGDIDIVIGISSLIGVRLSENFPKFPYIQPSLTKFWQNWQTTIVNFLTAYVYFPLCRNRKRVYLKTMLIIMIIGWGHLFYNTKEFPALPNIIYYTLWGIFLGGAFALSKYIERKKIENRKSVEEKHPLIAGILYSESRIAKALGTFLTFNIIAVGWHSPLYLILVNL